ncbi:MULTISPECIES: 5-formyltetrahydrofolate cyclo-ligase [Kocuria]|mgnify:CR=1 FL=1|uniref:5-formyltetrahydrofolate cyclo-ligase n=1 Tax=Kocuria TaxID=57493 RepID=UPI000DB8178B|nr:5-formyltetrahydrofolate cyclo-ligase [Kocuria carniphila]MCT1802356.1 5-formyltetrahydrofolate cyclo-ligase [Kocuria carniphila]PZP32689.1 MAG: 5-formyltetrahydrofolate cyclo-ligase [Kocuria rhizophila]
MTSISSNGTTKADLRRRILTERRRRSPQVRQAAAHALTEHLMRELARTSTGDLAAFLPLDTEPPLLAALEAADQAGHRVWVPVVETDRAMRWCQWRPGIALAPGSLPGLREPIGPRHDIEVFRTIALMVIPAVAVGADGVRLGFGGGYYDRFLEKLAAAHPLPEMLACVFHDEILVAGSIPREPHDAVMTKALTERGVVGLGSSKNHTSQPSGAE